MYVCIKNQLIFNIMFKVNCGHDLQNSSPHIIILRLSLKLSVATCRPSRVPSDTLTLRQINRDIAKNRKLR